MRRNNEWNKRIPTKQSYVISHTWFKDENPSAIEEEKNSEAKFDWIAESFDIVNVVI